MCCVHIDLPEQTGKMVRQTKRKSIEELYGSKYETTKSQVHNNSVHNGINSNSLNMNGLSKANRTTMDYGYQPLAGQGHNGGGNQNGLTTTIGTARRPRNTRSTARGEKTCGKEEYVVGGTKSSHLTEEMKKEQNAKSKTSRGEKNGYNAGNMYMDNKQYGMYTDRHKEDHGVGDGACQRTYRQSQTQQGPPPTHQHHYTASHQHQHPHHHGQSQQLPQHQHHHHNATRSGNHDDDKDDDTEEFFDLIRQTVEGAIGVN